MKITKKQLLNLKPCSIPNVPDVITLDWALDNLTTKQILWVISKLGYRKELILFSVFCARQNEHLLSMQSIYAINVVERFAYGMARKNEIKLAKCIVAVAVAAADADAYSATYATDAATDAAHAHARARAAGSAADSADYAADAAATYAAVAANVTYSVATYSTAKKDQLTYLRSLFI